MPTVTSSPEREPLSLDGSAQMEKKNGWLASLLRQGGRQGGAPEQTPEQTAETVLPVSSPESSEPAQEGEVVELLSEQVLVEESGVQELTPADMVSSEEGAGEEDGLIELEAALIHEAAPVAEAVEAEEALPQSVQEEAPAEGDAAVREESSEEMEAPSERIVEGLNRISQALIQGDVQAIRSSARELSFIADRYGMHTLADMARCFRAAWEEGDVEAAAQIVEEMRTEASRM